MKTREEHHTNQLGQSSFWYKEVIKIYTHLSGILLSIPTSVFIFLQNLSEVKDKSLPKYTNPGSSREKRNIIAENEKEWEQSERDGMPSGFFLTC